MLRSGARRPKLIPMSSTSRGFDAAVGHVTCIVALLAACGEDLVRDVPTDSCASGKRWVGELTASDEMFPGTDCVGCHRALDGPELMAAGTVYGLPDADGSRTVEEFCFGVEGAQVTITTADGEVLQTRTNRAGNFYFQGRPESLVTPYRVEVEYTLANGHRTVQPMVTQPSYGGCGYCHNPAAEATPGVEPGGTPAPDAVIEGAYPIWTGPLYE